MGKGYFDVTQTLLLAALSLPANTLILGAEINVHRDTVRFVVDHEDIPGANEGDPPRLASPRIGVESCAAIRERPVFMSWGLNNE